MSNHAAVVSQQRSAETFAEVRKVQHQIAKDFERHDERQELFKQQFLRETRKHHQCICEAACAASSSMSAAAASALLLAQHDVSSMNHGGGDPTLERSSNDTEAERKVKAQLKQLRSSSEKSQAHIWNGLKNLYTPPDVTTGIICETCFAFRSASLVLELPSPWREFTCESEPTKHYYYHPETRKVLWRPPPDTGVLSLLVFERTNSVLTVCRCKPSRERRRRLMQEFREHAVQTAAAESAKRDRQLRGAFSSTAISLIKKQPQ
ncbi:hypothetical protein Gpo141_00007190 [Globisporangium polare]